MDDRVLGTAEVSRSVNLAVACPGSDSSPYSARLLGYLANLINLYDSLGHPLHKFNRIMYGYMVHADFYKNFDQLPMNALAIVLLLANAHPMAVMCSVICSVLGPNWRV